ncbi:MAG: outer membrane lipoprotein carrier protein LolA [Holosporaceae bacterium]|jgi:outer membrane lipoprotein-sorting protein|nr:outer membrane lipoprotein carrier protein LolA [Holosporaceae bacterium]
MIKKIAIVALGLSLSFNIYCQQNKAVDYVVEIEKYLNNITTFESDFIQQGGKGHVSQGHLYIKRPFSMKMSYKNPQTHVVIAKKNKIIYYDYELKEKTETSTYSSPLSFFLERKIDLQKNLKVLSVQDEDDMLAIRFCKKDDDAEGAVILIFSKDPLVLRKWIILPDKNDESLSGATEVSLLNWKTKHNISDEEFKFSGI